RCLSDWSSDVCSSDLGLETSVNLITASGNIYTLYCTSTDGAQADLKVFVEPSGERLLSAASGTPRLLPASDLDQFRQAAALEVRSEERRVGKECRRRG